MEGALTIRARLNGLTRSMSSLEQMLNLLEINQEIRHVGNELNRKTDNLNAAPSVIFGYWTLVVFLWEN